LLLPFTTLLLPFTTEVVATVYYRSLSLHF
jgi:hypothetical protein